MKENYIIQEWSDEKNGFIVDDPHDIKHNLDYAKKEAEVLVNMGKHIRIIHNGGTIWEDGVEL